MSRGPLSYNRRCPTARNNRANVSVLDGHGKRVSFQKPWQIRVVGVPVHSFWYLDD